MPDNSGDAPSGLAEDRIAALEAGFAGLTELLEALRSDLQRPIASGSTPTEPRAPASSVAAASSQHDAPARAKVSVPQPHRGGPSAAAPSLVWEEWAHLIGPGFSVQPSPGLSPIPQLYDISSDETHRQLIARRHFGSIPLSVLLGFYDAVAHAALFEALASIKRAASAAQPLGEEDLRLLEAGVAAYDASNKHRRGFLAIIRLNASNDADARTKTVAQVVRRSLLKPGFADYGSEAVAQLSDELLRREAEYSVTAAAKAAVKQRFGVGPDPNGEEDNDDVPPFRARRRRPSGRRPRPDFRPTADDADKGKGKGKA
eukprot:jgi/Tetstr1/428009/TSEL_018082.t1